MSGGFLLAVALGYAIGAIGWLRTAQSAFQRSQGLERQKRPSDQWRTLAAKDAIGSLLFAGLAVVSVARSVENTPSVADLFLVLGVGPMALSLALGQRFERLSRQVAATEDLVQRRTDEDQQHTSLLAHFAEHLAGPSTLTAGEVQVRTLYEPVEGIIGGDFVGFAARGSQIDLVVGDVAGHGLDAALAAMRLKDLLMAEMIANQDPARALAMANAFFLGEGRSEFLATAFVARYGDGTIRYASAGHPPAMIVDAQSVETLPPTGPLLGVMERSTFEQRAAPLAPGRNLIAFTDGLSEAYGRSGGIDASGIARVVHREGLERLYAKVCAVRHEPVRDDIAAIELRRSSNDRPAALLPARSPAV